MLSVEIQHLCFESILNLLKDVQLLESDYN